MKIELPLETWTELFGFVPRSQLIKLVPHFGETRKRNGRGRKRQQTIGDRQFISCLQFFLHKFGEVTLGELDITSSTNGNEPIVKKRGQELPLAVVPMPENVKDFHLIVIGNYGESVIAFVQKFEQNSLLHNVNLSFSACPNFLMEIMTNFVPLFTSVNSIAVYNPDVLDQLQYEYSELAIPMFTSARVLFADYNCRDFWFCDWLHIPREDGKPRILFLYGRNEDGHSFTHAHFIKYIKKDFLEASQPVSFFIKLENFRDQANVQSLTLENGQTQEKLELVIKGVIPGHDSAMISRYPMGTNEEWIEAMSQFSNIDNRKIEFYP